ncbi:MAG TPA: aldose 1-epimerase family protein [Nocardioidaceae bacterium]|nr:aldose 1-epimerase family protein [Nocardioidaceae bacterium]
MVAVSGEQYEFHGGGYRAVVTECGAGLRLLEHEGTPLIAGYDASSIAPAGRGQLLLPWPNRIRDGRYTFAGQEHQLALTEPARGNASHGLTRWAAWTLEEQTEHSVSLMYRLMAQKGYPWTVDLHVLYDLSAEGLTVTVTATNLSDTDAPYAQGAHPYLSVTGGDADAGTIDNWEVTIPADTWVEVDDRKIPVARHPVDGTDLDFRSARALGGTSLDTPFTDLRRDGEGRAEVTVRRPDSGRGVGLWADRAHRWLQVYTGDDLPSDARGALAVEPMTAPPDAFRSGDDLVTLAPAGQEGDEHSSSWGIRHLG